MTEEQRQRIQAALQAALEELEDSKGNPQACIEYALIQLEKVEEDE